MQSPEGKIFAGNILCQEHREMIHYQWFIEANDRLVVSRTLLFLIRIHYVIVLTYYITYRIRLLHCNLLCIIKKVKNIFMPADADAVKLNKNLKDKNLEKIIK